MNPTTQSKNATILLVLIAVTLSCLALSPQARATCQEGCDLSNNNTFLGNDSLLSNTTGFQNTASGSSALYRNTTGFQNTASGSRALYRNTTGFLNTASGYEALFSNNTGGNNTAIGAQALYRNTSGFSNTATGQVALYNDTTGSSNTAAGVAALFSNTTGGGNTAAGVFALYANSTGNANTADGVEALYNNTTGLNNTAIGYSALNQNNIGSSNTASGFQALFSNIRGSSNTAIGLDALQFNSVGSDNIALGDSAGINLTVGSNNIDIGNNGVAGESNTIRIGTNGTHTNTYMAGISGATVAGGVGVVVDSNGQLGTIASSARCKDNIQAMDKVSEAILALKPVTFRYKKELDPKGIPQFGLVAEQVEKVNPDLVARDEQGKPYTVRYDAVNAMLLNEFLKEHRTVQELKSGAAKQEATIAKQQEQIEALTTGLQKVSAQLEVSKSARQVVLSNQ